MACAVAPLFSATPFACHGLLFASRLPSRQYTVRDLSRMGGMAHNASSSGGRLFCLTSLRLLAFLPPSHPLPFTEPVLLYLLLCDDILVPPGYPPDGLCWTTPLRATHWLLTRPPMPRHHPWATPPRYTLLTPRQYLDAPAGLCLPDTYTAPSRVGAGGLTHHTLPCSPAYHAAPVDAFYCHPLLHLRTFMPSYPCLPATYPATCGRAVPLCHVRCLLTFS